ncbi:MAG: hypothetical protein ACYDAL_09620 [Candidatus Dormibacteraceae bacterium]
MPTADMDPHFESRLKAALDRITPPASTPRYASTRPAGFRAWRIAPVLLAGATAILVVLAATAATGSPNPVVWTGYAAAAIGSVAHTGEPRPIQSPSEAAPPAEPHKGAALAPTQEPDHESSPGPEPSQRPEESPRPQPSDSPTPSDDKSGSGDH